MEQFFSELADKELKKIISKLPEDSVEKTVLFTEIMRVFSYWSIFQNLLPEEKRFPKPDFELMQWGWNLAVEHLYTKIDIDNAFPIQESTTHSQQQAINLLYRLGVIVLFKRSADMIRYGYLSVKREGDKYTLKRTKNSTGLFRDNIEFIHLDKLEEVLSEKEGEIYNGWQHMQFDNHKDFPEESGSFFLSGSESGNPFKEINNIHELMKPLIKPWDSGHGVMMAYGATPEIDHHFFSKAYKLCNKWRVDAGLHPSVKIGSISGAELSSIILFIASLHLKHIDFSLLANKEYSEISTLQSLTIWEPIAELAKNISDFTQIEEQVVYEALEAITLQPEEAGKLNGNTTPFLPLLISLGNGIVLRPICSLLRNPFISTITLQDWRYKNVIDKISHPREDWARENLYALFMGTRYKHVNGNIKLRNNKKIVTDIDGAIYDTVTGELALFQLKWQDYHMNDVKKLRSKASNLTRELDEWAEKVENWLKTHDKKELLKTLQLKVRKDISVTGLYLFGISQVAARMQDVGYETDKKSLAIATWPQFLRERHQLGPVERPFHSLFLKLWEDKNKQIKVVPMPVNIKTTSATFHYENLWAAYDDEKV